MIISFNPLLNTNRYYIFLVEDTLLINYVAQLEDNKDNVQVEVLRITTVTPENKWWRSFSYYYKNKFQLNK